MYAQTNTAVVKAPSRKLFAPMFKARWQNMQNIVNDSGFVDLIPEPYLSYYMAYIRQCLQWSRGFVPSLHRRDFFSTGMGYTVVEILTKECLSGGYRLDCTDKKVLEQIENWAEKTNFSNELYRLFWNANAGGNCIVALTPVKGQIYATAYPIDRVVFQVNRREIITSAMLLNRFTAGDSAIYCKEYRQMLNGKGYYKVTMAKGTLVNSPSWRTDKLKEIPEEIEEQFTYTYGDIELNTWYELPEGISYVGLYNMKNKPVAVAIADLPGYADSSLYTALDVLYSIDYNYTQGQVDMYMGKSRAIIPKTMSSGKITLGNVNVANGQSFSDAIYQSQLDDEFYTEIQTNTGEVVKPTFMQADLRAEAHKYIRDADLELLASKVGLSSSTLANHLSYNFSKTATEVKSEQDTTEKTVNAKRALIKSPLNQLLTDVARFYGFDCAVELAWGRAGANTSTENQELLADYNAGLLTIKGYLRKRWNDLSEEEIENLAEELKKEKAEKDRQDIEEYYKGLLNNNNDNDNSK